MDAPTEPAFPSQDNGMHSMACADPMDPRSPHTLTPEAGLLPKSSLSCHSKIPRPDSSCNHWSRQGSDSREFSLSCSTVPSHTPCPGCHREHLSQSSCYTQAQKTAQAAGLFPGPSQSFHSSPLILALRPKDPDPISQATSQPGRV